MPYVFRNYMLDPQCYELRRDGMRVPLRPKVFQVLTYLIEQRHRVVTRDELLAQVWPHQYVGEETLTSCVKAARRALGDSGQVQGVIQTVHGRGLRFVAEVTVTDTPLASLTPPPPPAPTTVLAPPQPLVGREAELTHLHQWYTTARQGQRQVGFITGEVGIGKTALLEAFVAQVAAEVNVWIGHGQCVEPYGPGEAYLPVLEALGRLCRGPEGAHFLAWLRQHAPSWLAQMPALLADADRATCQQQTWDVTQARMLRELAEALEALTVERPLLLILEDLHWSDGATLEWLAYVARRRDPARLLILGTYRLVEARVVAHPLYPVTRELLVHGQGTELVLGPLSRAEVTTYMTQRFGEGRLVAELIPVLYARTQGNPLFLITMVEDLVQRGVLRKGPSGWEGPAALDTATVGVPETLRHLIEQQFERLELAEQALIEAASVAGVDFAAAALAASVGLPAEDVDLRCGTFARQGQFVHSQGTATWPDGTVTGRYRFRHALYQEVVYARLPAGTRIRLHQQIGRRLETGYGSQAPEIAMELAEHFVRGQEVSQALHYLRQAVETAAQRAAPPTVIDLVQRVLALLATQPETAARAQQELELQLALGPALIATKGRGASEVERLYTRARTLCERVGEPRQLFRVLWGLWTLSFSGRGEDRRVLGEQLLSLAQRLHDPALLLEAHHALWVILFLSGEFTAAQPHLDQGLQLYEPQRHRSHAALYSGHDPGVCCRMFAAPSLWFLGYPNQAVASSQAALALAQQLAHPYSLTHALFWAAVLHHLRREASLTQAHAEAAMTVATDQEFPEQLAWVTPLRGWALAAQEQGAAGITQIQQGLAAAQAMGATVHQAYYPYFLALLAEASAWSGQTTEGLAALAEALANDTARWWEAELYRLRGELLLQHPGTQPEQAEACFQEALAIARCQQAKSLELRAALSLARLWQQQGKRKAASALLAPVYGWFIEGFDTADLQEAQALLAELAGKPPTVRCDGLPSPDTRNGAHRDAGPRRATTAHVA
jgi:predicted ATPase